MHELAITEGIVSGVCDRVGAAKVTRVIVEIGKLSGVEADSVRFYFELCRAGTPLAEAQLEIIEIPGRMRCRACDAERDVEALVLACPCGSLDVALQRGDELLVKAVEVV